MCRSALIGASGGAFCGFLLGLLIDGPKAAIVIGVTFAVVFGGLGLVIGSVQAVPEGEEDEVGEGKGSSLLDLIVAAAHAATLAAILTGAVLLIVEPRDLPELASTMAPWGVGHVQARLALVGTTYLAAFLVLAGWSSTRPPRWRLGRRQTLGLGISAFAATLMWIPLVVVLVN